MTGFLRQLLAAILCFSLAGPVCSNSNDAVGNRTQKTSTLPGLPGGLSNYNANDQLATDTYDANGNTTASSGNGYVYDFENHLIQQGGVTIVYDGGWHSLNSGVAYPCGFGFCKGGTFFSSVLHFEILGQLLAAILSVAIAVPAFSSSCSVGNRLQKTSTLPGMPGTASSYNANDQLASDTYDNDGNTTASNGKGYSYDFENHLVQQAGITVVYDGDGNRVAKTTANGTTQFLVDDLNPTGYAQVMDEVQSSAAVRTYTWGLGANQRAPEYQLNSNHQLLRFRWAWLGARADECVRRRHRHLRLRCVWQLDPLHRRNAQ